MDGSNGLEKTSFHLQLMSKVIQFEKYPFVKLVIENNIDEQEYEELFLLLHMLDEQFEAQKKAGLLHFIPILLHFVGMLNRKLTPNETIYALEKEGHYIVLMRVFIGLIEAKEISDDI